MPVRFLIHSAGDNCIDSYELGDGISPRLMGRTPLPDAEGRNGSAPMVLSPDGGTLYAAFRGEPYRVYVFSLDRLTTELRLVGVRPLPANMCHISLDKTGRGLFGASFSGNLISVSPIDENGLPGPATVLETPPNPHFVRVTEDNRRLLVPSLGGDVVLSYDFDEKTGGLVHAGSLPLAAGSGPRHLVRSPIHGQWYVISEKASTVTMFAEQVAGELAATSPVSILIRPPDVPKASDICISPDGRTLYAAERNAGKIGVFDVSMPGPPVRIGEIKTVAFPRVLVMAAGGRLLMAASEKNSLLALHELDSSGLDERATMVDVANRPTWITIL